MILEPTPYSHFTVVDKPRDDWAARVAAHFDALEPPIAPRDVALIEGAALGRAALKYADRMRVIQLLAPARDRNYRVTMDGQAAVLAAVRARSAG